MVINECQSCGYQEEIHFDIKCWKLVDFMINFHCNKCDIIRTIVITPTPTKKDASKVKIEEKVNDANYIG